MISSTEMKTCGGHYFVQSNFKAGLNSVIEMRYIFPLEHLLSTAARNPAQQVVLLHICQETGNSLNCTL